jgi:hypothetical protein
MTDMFRRIRKSGWLIDPSKVVFGSVVDDGNLNLSRSHVKVKYRYENETRVVPLITFVRRCNESIRSERSLEIDQLLVAPIVKHRYVEFFDRLTDWGPATRTASRSSREPVRRTIAERRRSHSQD